MSLRNKYLITVVSGLVALSALMLLTYIQGKATNLEPNPFFMGSNCVQLKTDFPAQVHFSDVVDIDEDDSVLLISREEKSGIVGVYDPNMVMAFENTFYGLGATRYFSYDDYRQKTDAYILVNDELVDLRYDRKQQKGDLMYCVDSNSRFNYDGHTKKITSLAAMETFCEYVYIDYGNKEIAAKIVDKLIDAGYRRVHRQYAGLLKSIFGSTHGPLERVMIGGLLIYVFLCLATYWHFYNQRRKITIHFLHGGDYRAVCINLVGPLILLNIVGVVPAIAASYFLRQVGYFSMSNASLWTFLGVHVVVTSLIYIVGFGVVFATNCGRKRGDNFVR